MRLTIEKHPELAKLSSYFKKIEAIAEKLGIDVDELVTESRTNNTSMYMSFKKNILGIAQQRTEALLNRNKKGNNGDEASIVGLTIIINSELKNLN